MRKLQLSILGFITTLAMMVVLAGCYPDESASVDELDIVLTNYDSTYNFGEITAYVMPDTVIAILDPDNPDNNFEYKHTYDNVILSELDKQFGLLDYDRVTDTLTTKPDVGVLVSAVSTTYVGYYYYDWYYYWGWYPYWPPYYGSGYSYYYPWATTYNYQVGTVIVTMIDLKSNAAIQTDSVSVVWMGAINGLVEGSNIQTRIKNGIDQMFIQSPYL
jgi:hypothetical protein